MAQYARQVLQKAAARLAMRSAATKEMELKAAGSSKRKRGRDDDSDEEQEENEGGWHWTALFQCRFGYLWLFLVSCRPSGVPA